MQFYVPLLLLLCLSVNAGCAPSTATAGNHAQKMNNNKTPVTVVTARIIVKFTETTPEPSHSDFVKELSEDLGVSLHYLRPMSSGGAHIFIVENLNDSNRLVDLIKRLSERSDVVYAEHDSIMRHQ